MARKRAPLQVRQFSKGLLTELNPLETSFEHTSDEINMEVNTDGSRQKRLGFNLEPSASTVSTTVVFDGSQNMGHSMFRWENAGGDADKIILCVQVGNEIKFYDLDNTTVSSTVLHTKSYPATLYSKIFSYAVLDSLLVVVTGEKDVDVFEYDPDAGTISESTETLLIRDLFGVQSFGDDIDLTLSQNLEYRPSELTSTHTYNLRNQGWGISYRNANAETLIDPIAAFNGQTGGNLWERIRRDSAGWSNLKEFPANSDNLQEYVYEDPNDTDNRLVDRYFAKDHYENRPKNVLPPQGYFIIDALDRGTSRLEQEAELRQRDGKLAYDVTTLPLDRTPGGPTTISEFSGRIWYGGFSSIVEGGDSKSPRMGSFVLFSSLVKDRTDLGRCFQAADPTDSEDPDIANTDGGFIRIQEAYGIRRLVSLEEGLFVFAENGVWIISGLSDEGFTATDYQVEKLTNIGVRGANSVVLAENLIMYWGETGIFNISRNQFGEWEVTDLTETTIATYWESIPISNRERASGFYDSYNKEIRWVHNKLTEVDDEDDYSYELIYNLLLGAWTKNRVGTPNTNSMPKILNVTETQAYMADAQSFIVVDSSGTDVTDSSLEDVTVTRQIRSGTASSAFYLVITSVTGTISYSFGSYRDTTFQDWLSVNPTGFDAYMVTLPFSAGEPRSVKRIPTFEIYFRRTEAGFDSNLDPINESSCLISARFSWHNTASGNKWSTERQAYRYNRTYIPVDSSDTFDTGSSIIHTRNKIRGSGEAVAIKLNAESGKNLHIYGWAFDLIASNDT